MSADPDRQSYSPVPVLYYFDLKRTCLDCEQPFIFFAEEQKHWYETLGFSLDADCVRCTVCRKKQQGLERTRRRYEELFHLAEPSAEETMERVECSLDLIEAGLFHQRQVERVRSQLKKLQAASPDGMKDRLAAAQKRARAQGEGLDGKSP